MGGAPGHSLPRLRSRRQPQPLRGAPLLAPREARAPRPRRDAGEPRPLRRRDRRRCVAPLRGELLGRARARRRAEARGRAARRHRADRRPVRRRDGRASRLDRLPRRRTARRRAPARARAAPARGGPPHPHAGARARRLLVDGLHAAARSTTGTRGSTPTGSPPRSSSIAIPRAATRAVAKIARSLDRFVDAYPDDGGCDEGPSYWGRAGASLFEALELAPRGDGRAGRRLPRAGRAGDRPLHRERARRRRVVREHRRRVGARLARSRARLPLRPGDRRRDARRLRRVARRRGAARTARATSTTTAASPVPCRRSSTGAPSRGPRPRSRCRPRCGCPTCR